MNDTKQGICFITKQAFDLDQMTSYAAIKSQLISLIKKDYPAFSTDDYISHEALNKYRKKYLEGLIRKEHKELNKLDKEVVDAIQGNKLLSDNIEPEIEAELTTGQRMADKIATFGGQLDLHYYFFLLLAPLDGGQHYCAFNQTIRSVSFYPT